MASPGTDISAYPVLRIDELTLFDSEFLRKAAIDVTELISTLNAEKSDQRSMVLYLMKQVDAIQSELTRRGAQERIEKLLRGEVLSTSETNFTLLSYSGVSSKPPPSPIIASQIPVTESNQAKTSMILQVPTPSELRAREMASSANSLRQSNYSTDNRFDSSAHASSITNELLSSRSAPVLSSSNKASSATVPLASSAPSKKSLDALNNSFGVAFVVGATERKKRYLPKPKVAIDIEAEKDKGRNERRKAAMQRLMQKQEERQRHIEELKKQAKIAKSKKPNSQIISSGDIDISSSESESISGGDDDHDYQDSAESPQKVISDVEAEMDTLDQHSNVNADKESTTEQTSLEFQAVPDILNEDKVTHTFRQNEELDDMSRIKSIDGNNSFSSQQTNIDLKILEVENPSDNSPVTSNEVFEQKNNDAWSTIRNLSNKRRNVQVDASNNPSLQVVSTLFREESVVADPDDVVSKTTSVLLMDTNKNDELLNTEENMKNEDSIESYLCKDLSVQLNQSLIKPVVAIDSITELKSSSTTAADCNNIKCSNETISNSIIDEEADYLDWKLEETQKESPRISRVIGKNDEPNIKISSLPTSVAKIASRSRSGLSLEEPRVQYPYETFDMIFSSAYGPDGKCKFVRKGEVVGANSIYQSMTAICALYEEWMEVMEDYATVFSADNALDIPTNMSSEDRSSAVYKGGTKALHYRVKSSRGEVCNIINDVFQDMLPEWEELPSGFGLGLSWNFLWSWGRPKLNFSHLLVWQRVNHFPESRQLTRKDMLKRNIQSLCEMGKGKASGAYFEIMPQTYLLPAEFVQFVKAFHEIEASKATTGHVNLWIMKPVGLSRGRGITMVTDVNNLTYSQASVIQKYIENPLCLHGYKFDLRLYILVTSFCPLEAFIYKEGFARLSTHKFTLNAQDVDNKFVHLTNSSIQKQNAQGPTRDNPLMVGSPAEAGGSKISLLGEHGLWSRLQSSGYDTNQIWENICALVVKSLVAVDDKMTHQACCFEVFGYDVLIDETLRPWLIEVNASPSLARDNVLDVRVKNQMICDTILLLNPASFDRSALLKILKRRLKNIAANPFKSVGGKTDPDLNNDLQQILGDYIPRIYGEDPKYFGSYEKLCPNTKMFEKSVQFKNKIFKSTVNNSGQGKNDI